MMLYIYIYINCLFEENKKLLYIIYIYIYIHSFMTMCWLRFPCFDQQVLASRWPWNWSALWSIWMYIRVQGSNYVIFISNWIRACNHFTDGGETSTWKQWWRQCFAGVSTAEFNPCHGGWVSKTIISLCDDLESNDDCIHTQEGFCDAGSGSVQIFVDWFLSRKWI